MTLRRRLNPRAWLAAGLLLAAAVPSALAQDLSPRLRDYLVTETVRVAQERLAAGKKEDGVRLLDFAATLNPRDRQLQMIRLAVQADAGVPRPDPPAEPAKLAKILVTIATKDKVKRRALLFYAASLLIEPGNRHATAALAQARRAGTDTDFAVLLAARRDAIPEPEPERLTEVVDYLKPVRHFWNGIAVDRLDRPCKITDGEIREAESRFREREEAREADEELADTAGRACRYLRALLDERRTMEAKYERAQVWQPAMTTPGPEGERIVLEGRKRRAENAEREWQQILEDAKRGRAGRYVAKVEFLAKELKDRQAELVAAANPEDPPGEDAPEDWGEHIEEEPVDYSDWGDFDPSAPIEDDPEDEDEVTSLTVASGVAAHYRPVPDEEKAATPAELKLVLKETANWFALQERRLSANLGTRVYAEKNGQQAILYLHVTPTFERLEHNERQRLAESIWRMWAVRCGTNRKVPHRGFAHLVLVDNVGDIVGGSKSDDAGAIWVKE